MNTDMQSDSNRITEEELDAMEHKAQVMGDICTCCEDTRRLIAEVRRLRAEMPTAVYRMAPGDRQEIITSEHFIIYMKQTPPPPPPEMDEVDKLEAAILARWANEVEDDD